MLCCYTDVNLKVKEVIFKRSCLNSASSDEMLIKGELCLYFTAFLNNRQQPASD